MSSKLLLLLFFSILIVRSPYASSADNSHQEMFTMNDTSTILDLLRFAQEDNCGIYVATVTRSPFNIRVFKDIHCSQNIDSALHYFAQLNSDNDTSTLFLTFLTSSSTNLTSFAHKSIISTHSFLESGFFWTSLVILIIIIAFALFYFYKKAYRRGMRQAEEQYDRIFKNAYHRFEDLEIPMPPLSIIAQRHENINGDLEAELALNCNDV